MLKEAKYHHIGFAVASIEKAKPFYLSAGCAVSETVVKPVQKVKVAYARRDGFPMVELLEPLDETAPVCKILAKNGNTPYHCCYEVPDIKATIAEARKEGFLPLGRPVPGHGLDDALMIFLYNKDVGLVQVVETKH